MIFHYLNEAGILGVEFLKNNKAIMDWDKEVLIIPEPIEENKVESIIIPTRSNCVLQIKSDEIINSNVVAMKKHALNENVIIANSLSPVKDNKIIGNIINISEDLFVIDELTTSHLNWEPYTDNIFLINNTNERETKGGQSGRIKLLNESIKTEHLNTEEKQNIISICREYSDKFYLEGDYLTATDIVTNKIAWENLIKKKQINKEYHDKNLHEIKINVGNKVLIKEHNKRNTLSRNWTGPYEVLEIHDNENITVNKGRKGYRIHINNVKLFYETEL
jgi:hypothetical protein